MLLVSIIVYCIEQNFGKGKVWGIRLILYQIAKLLLPKFCKSTTSYVLSVFYFCQTLFNQIDFLHFCQIFLLSFTVYDFIGLLMHLSTQQMSLASR